MVRLNRTYYSLLNFKGKSPNLSFKTWYGLTVHIIRFYISQANFFKIGSFGRNSSELCKFRAIRPHSPRIPRNLHYSLTYYTLCFRHLPQQRTLRNSSELRKFRANSPTKSANSAKFAPFVNISYVSDTCPGRELSGIPANYADSVQFAHILRKPREICQIC